MNISMSKSILPAMCKPCRHPAPWLQALLRRKRLSPHLHRLPHLKR
jgi:hypothetical protein